MNQSVSAPIYLDQLATMIQTCPSGSRPAPSGDLSRDMVRLPILVVIHDGEGRGVMVNPAKLTLIPHTRQTVDASGRVFPEVAGRLVLHVELPADFCRKPIPSADPVAEEQPAEPPETATAPAEDDSPEALAVAYTRAMNGLEPQSPREVFAVDPDAISKSHRERHAKPAVPPSFGN